MIRRTRLRRLAAYVLLVWLFGLASGIVNACVLGEARHGAPVISHALHEHHAAVAMDGHAMHGGHSHPGDHGKPPCERLCDAPAAARSADNELGAALAGFWLAAAPLPATVARVLPARPVAPPFGAAPLRAAIPLPIAFARLTL